jgi:hypothetical protein
MQRPANPQRLLQTGHSSTPYRFWFRIRFIVNMCTRSVLNTLRSPASHTICRLSLGSCRSCALMYSHSRLTVCGRESCQPLASFQSVPRTYRLLAQKFCQRRGQ